MSDEAPVVFDDDNPEWTEADFARAKPISAFPELAAAFAQARACGLQKAPTKHQVTMRFDQDLLAYFKAAGPGWQGRMNAALRKAAGL